MRLETKLVESFDHTDIAGYPIDTDGLPFDSDFFRYQIPVVVSHVPGSFDERLYSPSRLHGRSYVINWSWAENGHKIPKIWSDRYGNLFTDLVTKGNNFSRAEIMESNTAPSGYIPYGLQEGDALLRVLKASQIMREAGIDTEWVVRIQEPKQLLHFPANGHEHIGTLVPPAEYKSLIIQNKLAQLAMAEVNVAEVDDEEDKRKLTESQISKMSQALREMDFFVTLRAVSTPYRIPDLIKDNGPNRPETINLTILIKIFDAYNLAAKHRQAEFAALGLPPELTLEVKRDTSIQNVNLYFREVLPKLLGLNMARLHNLDMAHIFPHAGNITGLGGLVDLDSVRGEVLGLDDEPVYIDDKFEDLRTIAQSNEVEMLMALLAVLNTQLGRFKKDKTKPDDVYKQYVAEFKDNFIKTYFEERGIGGDDAGRRDELLIILANLIEDDVWQAVKSLLISEAEPIVGDYVKTIAEEVCEEEIVLKVTDVAISLYLGGVYRNEDFLECLAAFESDSRVPGRAWLEEFFKVYFGGDNDVELVGQDVYEGAIMTRIIEDRLEQLSKHFEVVIPELDSLFKSQGIESLDTADLIRIFIALSMDTISASAYNVSLPSPDELWELMASAFIDFKKREDSGEKITAATIITYFKLKQHSPETITEIKLNPSGN